eukprot:TRINITY_DN1527_c1_g1_i3.p1 TRINITY_DN1527_c1_g1~~TRINITY_DN1527_c1_g1_i3.p1  ORF type:complete len:867 (+),score=160.47 TRINITY_DN1527_c1_g1_i3:77-2602(+)
MPLQTAGATSALRAERCPPPAPAPDFVRLLAEVHAERRAEELRRQADRRAADSPSPVFLDRRLSVGFSAPQGRRSGYRGSHSRPARPGGSDRASGSHRRSPPRYSSSTSPAHSPPSMPPRSPTSAAADAACRSRSRSGSSGREPPRQLAAAAPAGCPAPRAARALRSGGQSPPQRPLLPAAGAPQPARSSGHSPPPQRPLRAGGPAQRLGTRHTARDLPPPLSGTRPAPQPGAVLSSSAAGAASRRTAPRPRGKGPPQPAARGATQRCRSPTHRASVASAPCDTHMGRRSPPPRAPAPAPAPAPADRLSGQLQSSPPAPPLIPGPPVLSISPLTAPQSPPELAHTPVARGSPWRSPYQNQPCGVTPTTEASSRGLRWQRGASMGSPHSGSRSAGRPRLMLPGTPGTERAAPGAAARAAAWVGALPPPPACLWRFAHPAAPLLSRSTRTGAALRLTAVVMRHGDRSPVTGGTERSLGPHIDRRHVDFWVRCMPPPEQVATAATAFPVGGETAAATTVSGSAVTGRPESAWPYGLLTRLGAEQAQAVGAALARRLVKHGSGLRRRRLSSTLRVHCEASAASRTQQTAQWVMMGLFPGADGRSGVGTVHAPGPDQQVLVFDARRSTQTARLAALQAHSAALGAPPANAGAVRVVRQLLHIPERFRDDDAIDRAREVCACHEPHGLPLPGKLSAADAMQLQGAAVASATHAASSLPLLRVLIGPLVRALAARLRGATAAPLAPTELALWVGHDGTLHQLLSILGLHDGGWPPYCAAVVAELAVRGKRAAEEPLLRLSYQGRVWAPELPAPAAPDADGWLPAFEALAALEAAAGDPEVWDPGNPDG